MSAWWLEQGERGTCLGVRVYLCACLDEAVIAEAYGVHGLNEL